MSIDFLSPVLTDSASNSEINYLDGVYKVEAYGFEDCWRCKRKLPFGEVIFEWKFGNSILHRHIICPKDID